MNITLIWLCMLASFVFVLMPVFLILILYIFVVVPYTNEVNNKIGRQCVQVIANICVSAAGIVILRFGIRNVYRRISSLAAGRATGIYTAPITIGQAIAPSGTMYVGATTPSNTTYNSVRGGDTLTSDAKPVNIPEAPITVGVESSICAIPRSHSAVQ